MKDDLNYNLFNRENKNKNKQNTPGTAGGPGCRDRTLAVNSKKTLENQLFFLKK